MSDATVGWLTILIAVAVATAVVLLVRYVKRRRGWEAGANGGASNHGGSCGGGAGCGGGGGCGGGDG